MADEFVTVIVLGLAVFGMAFVASQDFGDLGDFSFGEKKTKMVFMDKSFGQIGTVKVDNREVNLGSFTVGETRGDVLAERVSEVKVSDKFFGGNKFSTTYNAVQPTGGNVSFEVLGRTNKGTLFVQVNGEEIFAHKMVATSTPSIKIPSSALNPGENKIVIGVRSDSFISETSYTLEDVEIHVNDRKFHDFSEAYPVYDYEVLNFNEGRLTFDITNSVKTQPLKILINGREVYSKRQMRVDPETVVFSTGQTNLHAGMNSITFKTDGEAVYEIENAELALHYYGTTDARAVRIEEKLNDTELRFAKSRGTKESLNFNYQKIQGSAGELIVDVNGFRHTLTPENGLNSIELNETKVRQDNIIIFRSKTAYGLNDVRLISERVKE